MIQEDATYAGMTVYNDGGIQGWIINDADEAVSWTQALLSDIASKAEQSA